MLARQKSGSVVCPTCGRLVGVNDEKCLNCGRRAPGLWGFAPFFQRLGASLSFFHIVLYGCAGMFLISIALNPSALAKSSGLFSLLSPGGQELFLLGSSGAVPIFQFGRWWTPLSAAWLHGGILHIGFNLYWLRNLGTASANIFGTGRTIIIYTASAITGFVGTSLMYFMPLPEFFRGAGLTLGASASLCGLVGALYAYARSTGNSALMQNVKYFVVAILAFGLLFPTIDNWAHIFGFLGGYVTAKALNPLRDESPVHMIAALACIAAFLVAIAASIIFGLPLYNSWQQ